MSTDTALSAEPLQSDAAASASASDFISSMLGGDSPAIESTPVHEPAVPRESPANDPAPTPRQQVPQLFDDAPQRQVNGQMPEPTPASPTAQQPTPAQFTPTPAAPRISDAIPPQLATAAQEFGMSAEQVNLWARNPGGLQDFLTRFTRNMLQPAQAQFPPQPMQPQRFNGPPLPQYPAPQQMPPMMPQQMFPQQQLPPQGAVPQQIPQQPLNRPAGGEGLWSETLKRDAFEPEVADLFERMHSQIQASNQAIAQFQAQQAWTQQAVMQQAAANQFRQAELAASAEFDTALARLPREAEALFGRGGYADISPNSPFFEARAEVFATYQHLRNVAAQRGLNPSAETLLRQAAAIAIPQQWQYIEQTSQAPRQTIHRPGRQSADIGGANEQAAEEDAARFIEERMTAAGQPLNRSDSRSSLGLLK